MSQRLVCGFCEIEVTSQREPKRVVGKGDTTAHYIHVSPRDAAGNPSCGRQFLREEDLALVDDLPEA